jgi:hypothetical protein
MAAFSGHQQSADVDRHPEKAKKTTKKMRAKDRPLANDLVTDDAFDVMLDEWFGNIARVLVPGGCFYIWGGYANSVNQALPCRLLEKPLDSQDELLIDVHPRETPARFVTLIDRRGDHGIEPGRSERGRLGMAVRRT